MCHGQSNKRFFSLREFAVGKYCAVVFKKLLCQFRGMFSNFLKFQKVFWFVICFHFCFFLLNQSVRAECHFPVFLVPALHVRNSRQNHGNQHGIATQSAGTRSSQKIRLYIRSAKLAVWQYSGILRLRHALPDCGSCRTAILAKLHVWHSGWLAAYLR